jgi:phage recombination protein Bet
MTTEIAVHTGSGLDITRDQDRFNDRQVAALRQLGLQDATPADLAVFLHISQRTGLDPFARQIYMIARQGKQTIQTGIDGFRLVARRAADRAGESIGYHPTEWADADGKWHDVWLSDEPPAAARVIVIRDGVYEFPGTAMYREYVQRARDGKPTQMWATKPALMLAKCAEALALRKAFPQDLAGLHTADEMRDEQPQPPRRVTAAQIRREPEPDIPGEVDPDTGEVPLPTGDWPEVTQPPQEQP